MTVKQFSHSTTVTTALVFSLCSGAFWSGSQFQRLQSDVDHIASRQQHIIEESEDWRKQTGSILSELKGLGRDNKTRLDYLSRKDKQ